MPTFWSRYHLQDEWLADWNSYSRLRTRREASGYIGKKWRLPLVLEYRSKFQKQQKEKSGVSQEANIPLHTPSHIPKLGFYLWSKKYQYDGMSNTTCDKANNLVKAYNIKHFKLVHLFFLQHGIMYFTFPTKRILHSWISSKMNCMILIKSPPNRLKCLSKSKYHPCTFASTWSRLKMLNIVLGSNEIHE